MRNDVLDEGILERVVDAMVHDICNCQSFSNPKPRDIVVYGGNGHCDFIALTLLERLGTDYEVEAVSPGVGENVKGRYSLDADWYMNRYGGRHGD